MNTRLQSSQVTNLIENPSRYFQYTKTNSAHQHQQSRRRLTRLRQTKKTTTRCNGCQNIAYHFQPPVPPPSSPLHLASGPLIPHLSITPCAPTLLRIEVVDSPYHSKFGPNTGYLPNSKMANTRTAHKVEPPHP